MEVWQERKSACPLPCYRRPIQRARTIVALLLLSIALLPWIRHGLDWPRAVIALLDHCGVPACDFAKVYLPQARGLFEGFLDPRWFYPPLLAILLQGLAGLSDWPALWTWVGLNLAAAAALIGLCQRQLAARWGTFPALAAAIGLVTLALPVVHTQKWGQVSLMLSLLGLWALAWPGKRTGPLLGLAVAIKLYPVAWLLGPILRRDEIDWRAIGAWSLGLGVLLPLAVLGVDRSLPFVDAVASPVLGDHNIALGSQTLQATCHRWFVNGLHGGLVEDTAPRLLALPGPAVLAITVGLALLVGWCVYRMRHADRPLSVAATIIALALLLPPGWHHYFVLLPFVWAVVLGRVPSLRSPAAILVGLAWLLSALPLLLLTDGAGVYFTASAYGITTISALLTLVAGVLSMR